MGENPKSDREIFNEALEIDDAGERATFLDKECSGDAELRSRVQTLLDAFADAGEFMATHTDDSSKSEPKKGNSTRIVKRPEEGPGSVIDNYKVLQEIGEGGFGVVYMAEQIQPVKRKVALKIIKPGMDTREVVARFEAERQALALMIHPNIAQVLDAGATETGRPFFVMELVKGIPITQFCDKNKLSTVKRLRLFIDICGAIQHAHQKGVIHRDIKPSNILITLHDGTPVPKVIDFGIAKAINQELTEKTLFTAYGQMIGTPQYTSPEQAEMSGLDIDTRSDIYSLGVLLYELLTGETPISRNELKDAGFLEMQKLIQEKEPTKPSMAVSVICQESTTLTDFRQEEPAQLISAIKGDLDWIVLKALDKDRTRRYETANGFARDVERYLANEPVSASPPTLPYILGKFARRNKRLLTAVSAVFLALFIGAIGMTFLYIRAKADREDAVTARQTAEEQTKVAQAATVESERSRAAETEQRQLAQRNAEHIRNNLTRADFVSGVESLARNDDRKALAYLAHSLRTDGTYLPAAQALLSALRDRNHDLEPIIELRHDAPISSFTLDESGSSLITRATDGTVRLWDASTHELREEFGRRSPLKSASFSRTGTLLVTLGSNRVAQVWALDSLSAQGQPITTAGGIEEIKSAVSPDGGLVLATRSRDQTLRIWDGITGKPVTPPLIGPTDQDVLFFGLKEDGSRLFARFGSRWVYYWNTRTGKPTGEPINILHTRYRAHSTETGAFCTVERRGDLITFFNLESGGKIKHLSMP